jgi:hypothetical protein
MRLPTFADQPSAEVPGVRPNIAIFKMDQTAAVVAI